MLGINALFSLLTFLIFTCTTQLTYIKILLLLLILFILLTKGKVSYSMSSFHWILIYLLLNLCYLILGQVNGGKAFELYGMLYLVEPILYFIIVLPTVSLISDTTVEKSLFASFIFVDLIVLAAYIARRYNLTPMINVLEALPCTIVTDNRFGYISVSSVSISGLFFLIPYFTSLLFKSDERKQKLAYGCGVILGLADSFLVGRRGLLAVIFISLIVYWGLNKAGERKDSRIKLKIDIKKQLVFLIVFIIIIAFAVSYFQRNGANMRLGNLSSDLVSAGDRERNIEVTAMIREWERKPIFGTGYAINAEGSIRSDIVGSYEYSYLAMLYQTGLVGTIIYLLLYFYLANGTYKCWKLTENKHYLATCVGLISLLIGNATNPYIESFDGMWTLFYCLALINKSEVENVSEKEDGKYPVGNI